MKNNLEFVKALIREMNDSYKRVEEKKKLHGNQTKIASAAPPEDEITAADFKAIRAKKGVKEDQSVKTPKLGNEIGDKVYFKGDIGKEFPSSEGFYGVIKDVEPASNYNMMAIYTVVVYDKSGNEVTTVNADWTNLSNKPINENHEGTDHEVSMANNSIDSIIWAANELKKHLQGGERDIPAWIQDHITNAENYILQAAKNYHEYGAEEPEQDMSLSALAPEELNEMIKKKGSKYVVYSKKGKKLGSHPSKKKAQKQLAAIEISKQGK